MRKLKLPKGWRLSNGQALGNGNWDFTLTHDGFHVATFHELGVSRLESRELAYEKALTFAHLSIHKSK